MTITGSAYATKVAGPAENGNRQHYKTWCEQVPGVGRARIIPLWDGENTVKGIIIGADGTPAVEAVVDEVQEVIDPGGAGLGDGVANIGAHFTAISAQALNVNIVFKVELSPGAAIDQAVDETTAAVTAYLRELALQTPENEAMVVRITTIGAMLHNLPSIVDYADLTLNGGEVNIDVSEEQVAVLGEVSISEIV